MPQPNEMLQINPARYIEAAELVERSRKEGWLRWLILYCLDLLQLNNRLNEEDRQYYDKLAKFLQELGGTNRDLYNFENNPVNTDGKYAGRREQLEKSVQKAYDELVEALIFVIASLMIRGEWQYGK